MSLIHVPPLLPMEDEWLDVDEALTHMRAKGLQITKKSLYTSVSRFKRPKSYKIGRRLRFKKSDLDAHIASVTTVR